MIRLESDKLSLPGQVLSFVDSSRVKTQKVCLISIWVI